MVRLYLLHYHGGLAKRSLEKWNAVFWMCRECHSQLTASVVTYLHSMLHLANILAQTAKIISKLHFLS